MNCKKILAAPLACGFALSALAFAPAANAQGGMMSNDTMMSTTTTTTTTMAAPMQVTGTVLRYYSDRAGYLTAMDLQTANGVEFIRFSPGMAQRIYSMAPVGGTATVYVTGSPTTRWDVVGVGNMMPSPNFVMATTPSDIEMLDSVPYIMAGAKQVTVSGDLADTITNNMGEVVGLVLSNTSVSDMNRRMMMTSMGMNADMAMAPNWAMPMNGMTLVRVGREFRHSAPGSAGTNRVAALFKGADVVVTGYPEAPRYGVVSNFQNRIAANALVVNGRNVGAIGIQKMMGGMNKNGMMGGSMMGGSMMGGSMMSSGTMTPEQMRARNMGYTTYTTTETTVTTTMPAAPMN